MTVDALALILLAVLVAAAAIALVVNRLGHREIERAQFDPTRVEEQTRDQLYGAPRQQSVALGSSGSGPRASPNGHEAPATPAQPAPVPARAPRPRRARASTGATRREAQVDEPEGGAGQSRLAPTGSRKPASRPRKAPRKRQKAASRPSAGQGPAIEDEIPRPELLLPPA